MSFHRHQHFEELVSASLGGELTDAERAELDAHLDTCDACRATLAAFADQRRIVAGLRHVPAPRDLGARVRGGIEAGAFAHVPWWRRPAVLFAGLGGGLAAVAGVLLALVVLNGAPDDPQVGAASEAPIATASTAMTSAPIESPSPSATAAAPSVAPTPELAPEPPEADPQPDVYLAYTGAFDNLLLTLRNGRTGGLIAELPAPGVPVAAQLSPNGQFLAYITQRGESGMHDVWVTHVPDDLGRPAGTLAPIETPVAEGATVELGESMAGSEFLEQLFWSPDGAFLTYTLAMPAGSDAWIFDVATGAASQFTSAGNAYASGWFLGGDRGALLWALISVAGPEPATQVHAFADYSNPPGNRLDAWPIDPGQDALATIPGAFQPLISPDASRVIFWRGQMRSTGGEWTFAEGGSPYIAELRVSETAFELLNERPLFSDVTIDRDAFTSAGIVWGADSDAYAVWDAEWTGIPQGAAGEYPNVNRVYFGHASDDRELTEQHAIDAADLPEGASVVDVKVPTTRHLLVTAQQPIGGVMDVPRASLILVSRNTGNVPDEVFTFTGPGDDAWFGPPAFDAYWEATAP